MWNAVKSPFKILVGSFQINANFEDVFKLPNPPSVSKMFALVTGPFLYTLFVLAIIFVVPADFQNFCETDSR